MNEFEESPVEAAEGVADAVAEDLPRLAPDLIEQEHGDEFDDIVPSRGYQLTPMVGLGGSAGSIPAMGEFFRAMPAESGMIFVVILHLSPEHESALPQVLAKNTAMRVIAATNGMRVETNCVYVIPPGKHLMTVNGHLKLEDLDHERGKRVAVDLFFRSLADTHGPARRGAGVLRCGFGRRGGYQADQGARRADDRAGSG